MKIIRDEELGGLFMIPLLVDWHITRCNVTGCKEKPNTIVTQLEDLPPLGFCEQHFQEANTDGGAKFTLDFKPFDAFKAERIV